MVQPIARLHALEMILEVMIADRAAQYENGEGWMTNRKNALLSEIADTEQAVLEAVGSSDGLAEIHTVVADVFAHAERILPRLRPKNDVPGPSDH